MTATVNDTEIVFCRGDVDPDDRSHDFRIVAVDGEIHEYLKRRARRNRRAVAGAF